MAPRDLPDRLLLGMFALLAVFAQFRFGDGKTYYAVFTNVTGLKSGNFVRIAGVEVGKVKNITLNPTPRSRSSSPPTNRWCSPRAPGRRSATTT